MISSIKQGAHIKIGSNCGLSGTVIGAAEYVELGINVLCGGSVTITDTDRHGIPIEKRRESGLSTPVIIEDDVWLGLNVTVLNGVTIGRGSVVTPGSVVGRSIPQGVVAGGNPARVISNLSATENA